MNAHQKQIEALVLKLRAWRNRGGSRGPLVVQIKKLNRAWDRQQRARLKAFEQQLHLEAKRRTAELGKIIEADNRRDYEEALAAIGYTNY